MSGFSKIVLAAVFVGGSVAAASSAVPERMRRDRSGAWHVQQSPAARSSYDHTQRFPDVLPWRDFQLQGKE